MQLVSKGSGAGHWDLQSHQVTRRKGSKRGEGLGPVGWFLWRKVSRDSGTLWLSLGAEPAGGPVVPPSPGLRGGFQGPLGELGQVGGGEVQASLGLKKAQVNGWQGPDLPVDRERGSLASCRGGGCGALSPWGKSSGCCLWTRGGPPREGRHVPPRQGLLEGRGPWQEEAGGGLTGARGKGKGHKGTLKRVHLLG